MTHRVVAGALVSDEGVLLCSRSLSRSWYPGVWDFAGGHIVYGELPIEALRRELHEELGIDIQMGDREPDFVIVDSESEGGGMELSGWVVDSWNGTPENVATDEHDEIQWFTLSQAIALDLAHPRYIAFLESLIWSQPHELRCRPRCPPVLQSNET